MTRGPKWKTPKVIVDWVVSKYLFTFCAAHLVVFFLVHKDVLSFNKHYFKTAFPFPVLQRVHFRFSLLFKFLNCASLKCTYIIYVLWRSRRVLQGFPCPRGSNTVITVGKLCMSEGLSLLNLSTRLYWDHFKTGISGILKYTAINRPLKVLRAHVVGSSLNLSFFSIIFHFFIFFSLCSWIPFFSLSFLSPLSFIVLLINSHSFIHSSLFSPTHLYFFISLFVRFYPASFEFHFTPTCLKTIKSPVFQFHN